MRISTETLTQEFNLDVEARVHKIMGLPPGALTLDGDHVLNNRKDYTPTDEQRDEFKRRVKFLSEKICFIAC